MQEYVEERTVAISVKAAKSNKYSIDAEGLAEAIRISAGTLTQAHTSIEQAATMFTTANRFHTKVWDARSFVLPLGSGQ